MLKLFKSKNLQSVKHGFFGRSGGVSTGIYSSLNLSEKTADSAMNICANRALVMDKLEITSQKIFFPNQQHTNKSVFINKETDLDNIKNIPADAVITNMDGIGVGILTADCSPILAYESESGFILAIHAGWKGALAGVCENALNSLKDLGVNIKKFSVAIGPTISTKCYEVKIDFVEAFIKTDPYFENFSLKKMIIISLILLYLLKVDLIYLEFMILLISVCVLMKILNYFFQIEGPIINLRETLVEWLQ